jgi:tetratricopeptide (TPR) repeat protein
MSIAQVLAVQGKNEEALEKYQQVMPIYEKEFGSDSVQMAQLLHCIALALRNQGEYKVAMEKINRCLAIEEKLLGTNHASTIRTRNNIKSLKREMLFGHAAE